MIVRELAGPAGLVEESFEPTPLTQGQVRIEVRAIGVNFFDGLITAGTYQRKPELPFSPGAECAGIVVESKSTRFSVGDRILALVDYGAYTSELVVTDERVYAISPTMSFEEAAGFGIVYQTSYFSFVERAQARPKEIALIHAAAGGVGLAAVQIGKALGLTLIGTAGSPEKLELIRDHGVDHPISYRDDNWLEQIRALAPDGVDVVIDPVGGDAFDVSTKCIAFEGRIVVVGFASGRIPTMRMNRVLLKNIAVTGLHWGAYYDHDRQKLRQAHKALMALYDEGKLKPLVSETHPLKDATIAIERLMSRKTIGKVVLKP